MHSTSKLLVKRWKVIATGGVIVAAISFGVSLIMPLEYRADAQISIITRQQYGVDPFTTSKSAERIADTLANTVETDAFYAQVVENNAVGSIRNRFDGLDPRKRRKAWRRAVEGSTVFGTNLLNVSVFARNADDAERLAAAVAKTVVDNGSDYVGTVIVARIVNQPIASKFPVRPNLALNALLGFFIGIIGTGWAVARRHGNSVLS